MQEVIKMQRKAFQSVQIADEEQQSQILKIGEVSKRSGSGLRR